MKSKYYHLTETENVESVLKEGLLANEEGEIFLFDRLDASMHIAANVFSNDKMAIMEINAQGIQSEITKDNVAEFFAEHLFIVKQDKIEPKYVRFKRNLEFSLFGYDLIMELKRLDSYSMDFAKEPYEEKLLFVANKFKKFSPQFYYFIMEKYNEEIKKSQKPDISQTVN